MANKDKEIQSEEVKPQEAQAQVPMVSIPAAEWDKIVQKIGMLEAVADKGRVASFLSKQEQPHLTFVQLRTYETADGPQVVVGWNMTKDRVWKENGVWKEDQQVDMLLEDSTKQALSLADFYTLTARRIKAEVLERNKSFLGDKEIVTYKLMCEDGKERIIDERFVN